MKRTAVRRIFITAALFVCLGAAVSAAPAGEEARPDFLSSDPGFTELGALPDPLRPGDFKRAALLASGLGAERAAAYEARLDELIEALRAGAGSIDDPAAKGEAILGFLHDRLFKTYSENATTIDGIFDTGLYNCVSSAVVFMFAAKSLGLEAAGVRTEDHAFCLIIAGKRRIDVETTNRYGFDPGNKKEFKDSFGRATGYAYVAPGGYGDRKTIGDRALVGLILNNRASMLERAGRFPEAARLGADYDELCRDADSRAFLVSRVNNLVAELESRRDYGGAEAAARAAAAALPGEARLASLLRTAAYNQAAALAAAGDWAGAFDRASALKAEFADAGTPDVKAMSELAAAALVALAQSYARSGDFALARRAVSERSDRAGPAETAAAYAAIGEVELVRAANELPFAQAAATADRILAAGETSASRYVQAMATIYGNEAGRIGRAGDWLGGAALAEAGTAKLAAAKAPGDGGLAQLARSLRHNFVAEAHNRFAKLYNAGDYEGAAKAIEAAIDSVPGDPSLERDLKTAKAARKK